MLQPGFGVQSLSATAVAKSQSQNWRFSQLHMTLAGAMGCSVDCYAGEGSHDRDTETGMKSQ
jgi:hypothetical protein